MSPSQVRQYGELRLVGNFDPDEVTRCLTISPTRSNRRGELRPSDGKPREFSDWTWETQQRDEHDSEVVVLEVLGTFEPLSKALVRIRSDYGADLMIGLVVHMSEEDAIGGTAVLTPGIAFAPPTLARLAALGCSLNLDLYVDTLDDGPQSVASTS